LTHSINATSLDGLRQECRRVLSKWMLSPA
jgi:hypothetical protein